jgi:WD repeat-containing protein 45
MCLSVCLSVSRHHHVNDRARVQGTLIRVFSTTSGARLAELRRGIDRATIFSLAFSPSGLMLACTSDKSTLHIFDVPHPRKPARLSASSASPRPTSPALQPGPSTSVPRSGSPSDNGGDGTGKWGFLSKIPLMPRVFSDVYSFASTPFEPGEEPLVGGLPATGYTTLGTTRPPKGILGWLSEDSLLVIGAGKDARWEKFKICEDQEGKRQCVREGWKRYLKSD